MPRPGDHSSERALMCGIYGEVLLSDRGRIDPGVVRSMGDAIIHRGPDDDGVHLTERVAIGLRRLSIIDVAGGHQPLFNEDRTVAVVCNGEIYNFRRLRAELTAGGHAFRTGSDAEVLVHLYEEYGDGLLEHVEGMFGFALWDETGARLLLGRDRVGIKPLYYTIQNDRVVFCSESKALVGRADVGAALDPEALEQFLALGYVPNPHSLFAGVHKLRPGHIAVVERGRLTEHCWWQLEFATRHGRSEQDWIEEIDATLAEAVAAQMISDVPIGAFLSGGIDSSAIIAYMNRATPQPVRTYSIGYRGSSAADLYNELPFARQVADRFGTEHHEIMVEPDVISLLPELLWHMDEPTVDSALITSYLVSEFASREVKVILSGVGGDELFGGYNRYLMSHYVAQIRRVPGWLRRGVLAPLIRTLPEDRHSRLLNLFRYVRSVSLLADAPESDRYRRMMEVFGRRDLDALIRADARVGDDALARILARYADAPEADRILAADVGTQLTDELLLLTDKMSMAQSLECRVPLLDERLLRLATTMPHDLRVRGRRTRYILKKALRGVLPDAIIDRKKRGFGAPMGAWLRRELEPVTDKLLSPAAVERRGVLDPRQVTRILDEHRTQRADHTDQLMALLSLELWFRMFLDGDAPADLSAWLTAGT